MQHNKGDKFVTNSSNYMTTDNGWSATSRTLRLQGETNCGVLKAQPIERVSTAVKLLTHI
jgi:hypothetical protein